MLKLFVQLRNGNKWADACNKHEEKKTSNLNYSYLLQVLIRFVDSQTRPFHE